jgi:hypothetical protein
MKYVVNFCAFVYFTILLLIVVGCVLAGGVPAGTIPTP